MKVLQIHPADNVEVALTDIARGQQVSSSSGELFQCLDNIPAKHKYALIDFKPGDEIIMYGVLVGKATKPIKKGSQITTDNIRHAAESFKLGERNLNWAVPDISKWLNRTFLGYHRADGSVGVRNIWLIIPLVFCENHNVSVIQEAFAKELGYEDSYGPQQAQVRYMVENLKAGKSMEDILDIPFTSKEIRQKSARVFENIDGIRMLTHTLGCGGTREDARDLCGLLAGYVTNANVAGATIISLGCQNAQVKMLRDAIADRDANFSKTLYVFEQQEIGSQEKLIENAIKQTFAGLAFANKQERAPAPLSKLCVGLECGGSDGFSGISANPALGCASDILVALGASVILAEFPELCGVEQQLSDRCINLDLASKFNKLMTDYHAKAKSIGSGFDSNPSAGNVRDGLITDAIKSAGAAKKGGTSPIVDILDYPEKVYKSGLNLLCTPGSDIESTTAEVGAGATIVVFTTGLGTPTGNPVAPVLKVATNNELYVKMNDIIDINAGEIISGRATVDEVGEQIVEHIIQTASGLISAKADDTQHNEFIPWKRGISL